MKSSVSVNFLKTIVVSLAALMFLQGCVEEKETTPSTGGDSEETPVTVSLTGTYYTSCVAIPGMVIGGATHTRKKFQFGLSGVANNFEYTTFFSSDSSCSTNAYAANQQGTFAIGNSTTSPANGHAITVSVTSSDIIVYSSAAYTDLSSGCSSHGPWSAAPSIRPVYSRFNCANVDIEPATTAFYNVFVASGSSLSIGTPAGDNPGTTTTGAVSSSMTVVFTK